MRLEAMSPLGQDVFLLCERCLGAAYNHRELREADWTNPVYIELRWGTALATFDFSHLTALVIAAHDAALRMEISPRSNRYLTILFHRRSHDGESITKRHPTMEEAIRIHRRRNRAKDTTDATD